MGGVVFLSCYLFVIGFPALYLAGHWVELGLNVEMEISGRALTDWYYQGGLWWTSVLNLALPPQRLRPDTWWEHQDPVSHMVCVRRSTRLWEYQQGTASALLKTAFSETQLPANQRSCSGEAVHLWGQRLVLGTQSQRTRRARGERGRGNWELESWCGEEEPTSYSWKQLLD